MSNSRQSAVFRLRRFGIPAVALALLPVGRVAAQAQPDAPTPAASASTAAKTAEADKKQAINLGNITVTAQSRSQEVQAVPIPVQIVTQKQIDTLAATDFSKMNGYIPGLFVDGSQPTQPVYSLRGISVTDFGIGTDSPIGIYEDGVYTGKTGGALLMFNDIQRVEVLKGPQGTLFGRNSAGGAISVVTNEPGDDWEEHLRVRTGEYGTRYLDGVLNAPISSNAAFRLSLVDNQSDGWLHDTANGQHYNKNDDWGLRAQLRWNLAGTTVRLVWEHEKLNQPARPAIGLVPIPPAPGRPPFPANLATYIDPIGAPVYNDVLDNHERRSFDGVSLFVNHPFSLGDLSTITAYRHFTTSNLEDNDGTNPRYLYLDTENNEDNGSWYQEFKLSGKNDLLDWVVGSSYYFDNARQDNRIDLYTDSIDTILRNAIGGSLFGSATDNVLTPHGLPGLLGDPWQENMYNHGRYKAYALYGDVIWHLTDRLNLTTGLRFTRDEKQFSWYNPPRVAPQLDATLAALQVAGAFGLPGMPPISAFRQNFEFRTPASMGAPLTVTRSWNDFSPRVVLDYKLTPNVMLYASAAKGYQAGGFNAEQVGAIYQPETVWNYEAGFKSYFPDYHLLLNASLFYYCYSNLQSLNLEPNVNGALPLYVVTTSDQHAKGLELETHWQATKALRFNLTATYIDATYEHYIDSQNVDISGQPVGEPLWSAAAGLDYVWSGVIGGDLDLTVQQAFRGRTRCNGDSVAQGQCLSAPTFTLGKAQQRIDLRLGWSSSSTPWSAAVFVNNAFDKRYVQSINNISASVLGTPFAYITAPRTWGIELAVDF